MDPEAAAQIAPQLLAGESILWSGRPHESRSIAIRIIIIVVLGAAVLAMRLLAPESALGVAMMQKSLLLAAIVLAMVAEGAIYNAYVTSTFYAVTNQRVIILTGLVDRETMGVPLSRLSDRWLKVRRSGTTITISGRVIERSPHVIDPLRGYLPFTNPSLPPNPASNIWLSRRTRETVAECYRLVGIEDAGRVYALIMDTAQTIEEEEIR